MLQWAKNLNPKKVLTLEERKAAMARLLNNIDWEEDKEIDLSVEPVRPLPSKKPSADRQRWMHYLDNGVVKAHVM